MTDLAGSDSSWRSVPTNAGDAESPFAWAERREDANRVVVAFRGELDLASTPEIQGRLLAILGQDIGALTLDLGALTFLDSSGISALNRVRVEADEQGVSFALRAVPHQTRRVLEVTGMTDLFEMRGDSSNDHAGT